MNVAGMIVDDRERGLFRVNRRAFVEPALLAAEHERVFGRCWLYVGHESELAGPGSWIHRKVAGRQMIFVRDDDAQVRVFFDTCTHRGNALCRGSSGTAKVFQCFYHGWSFNTRGELVGVPDRKGYSAAFDTHELGLVSPPRIESYRGLVFMCLDADIIPLADYLGNAIEYIDLMLDFSDAGPAIAPSQHAYSMRANWKLMVENSIDVYHALITHRRYFIDFVKETAGGEEGWQTQVVDVPDNIGRALDNGHAVLETPQGPLPLGAKGGALLAEARRKVEAKFGKERAHRILDYSRNLTIFPNLAFVGNFRTLRTFYPVAVDLMEINGWAIVGRDESPELRALRLDNYISFIGPGGFGTPDDVEALENCQRSYAASKEVRWSDISRGMKRDRPLASDEEQMRSFWRRWQALMLHDELVTSGV